MSGRDGLIRVLRRQGVVAAGDLARLLDISAATLSRWVKSERGRVVRLGRTRGARYGLLDAIEGIGASWPVWMVGLDGQPKALGQLYWLHGPACFWEFDKGQGQLFEGLPPFVADMAPQGYLGRLFPRQHPELQLPDRITDWSERHILRAIVSCGDDLVGNLIIGEPAMNRFLARRIEPSRQEDYPAISRDLVRHGGGSSAAGEFPKFGVFDGEQHLLVKFTAGDDSLADRRWRDLLLCEHLAAEVLAEAGLPSARSRPVEIGSQLFLEIPRFDRSGPNGRRATLSLGAIDDAWFGQRDNWPAAASRLRDRGWISELDRQRILLLEAFGRLIFNNDRHFGNLSFFWRPGDAELTLELTPVYDMLPMRLAPSANGMVPDLSLEPVQATSELLGVWDQATELANEFWRRVGRFDGISRGFRDRT